MSGGTTPDVEGITGLRQIGVGGSSRVYVGVDEAFGRNVAVKILHHLDEKGRRRFDRERHLMGRFDGHPNVITPYRSGYTADGSAYLVMEHAANGSLQDQLDRGHTFAWEQAVAYLAPVGRALEAAHRQPILHLDIKPANILLTADWVPKLTDFGISAIQEATTTASLTFTLAHTPPETFAGGVDRRDERSDLYSLASTLYAMVAGRAPFEVDGPDSQPAYLLRIANNPVPTLGQGAAVDRFFATSLAKDPAVRPPTVEAFLRLLPTPSGGGHGDGARPASDAGASADWAPPERATRHVAPPPPEPHDQTSSGRGNQGVLLWAVAGIVAVLGGLLLLTQFLGGEQSADGGDGPGVVEAGQDPDPNADPNPDQDPEPDRDPEPEPDLDPDPDPVADQEVADRVVLQTSDLDQTWQASTRPPRSETLATYQAIPACASAIPAIRGDGETATAGRDQSFSAGTTAVGVTVTFYESEQLASERGPLLSLDRDFQQCTRAILEQSITATNPTLSNLASESGALPAPDYGQRTEAVQYVTTFDLDPLGPKTFYLNEWVVQIGRAVLVMTWSSDVAFDPREVEVLQIVATRFEAELATVGG